MATGGKLAGGGKLGRTGGEGGEVGGEGLEAGVGFGEAVEEFRRVVEKGGEGAAEFGCEGGGEEGERAGGDLEVNPGVAFGERGLEGIDGGGELGSRGESGGEVREAGEAGELDAVGGLVRGEELELFGDEGFALGFEALRGDGEAGEDGFGDVGDEGQAGGVLCGGEGEEVDEELFGG